jgi:hypothetical protein
VKITVTLHYSTLKYVTVIFALQLVGVKYIQYDYCKEYVNIKLADAKQERITCAYKNKKEKLLKTNAVIWFKRMRKVNHLTPI